MACLFCTKPGRIHFTAPKPSEKSPLGSSGLLSWFSSNKARNTTTDASDGAIDTLKFICQGLEIDFDSIFLCSPSAEDVISFNFCDNCAAMFEEARGIHKRFSLLLPRIQDAIVDSSKDLPPATPKESTVSSVMFGGSPSNMESCRRLRRQVCAKRSMEMLGSSSSSSSIFRKEENKMWGPIPGAAGGVEGPMWSNKLQGGSTPVTLAMPMVTVDSSLKKQPRIE